MKKTLIASALALGITGSSCIGTENLYENVKTWNVELSEIDAVNEILYIGMWIIPVYPIALGLDLVIFNTIDYWVKGTVINEPGPFPGFAFHDEDKAASGE